MHQINCWSCSCSNRQVGNPNTCLLIIQSDSMLGCSHYNLTILVYTLGYEPINLGQWGKQQQKTCNNISQSCNIISKNLI